MDRRSDEAMAREWTRENRGENLALTARVSGWPSPQSNDWKGPNESGRDTTSAHSLAMISGWATPRETDGEKNVRTTEGALREAERKGAQNDLGVTAMLAGWATPDAQAMNLTADPEKHAARLARLKAKHGNGNGAGMPIAIRAHLAGWATPNVPNGGRSTAHAEKIGGTFYHNGKKVQEVLESQARMSGWTTPRSADPKAGHDYTENTTVKSLAADASLTHGLTPSGSPASTAKRGALAPEFVCWLMGYPPEHLSSAPTATPSSRKSRRHS